MAQEREIQAVVAELDKLVRRRALTFDCRKLYCTTCGGTASYVDKHMDLRTRASLAKITKSAGLGDFSKFGIWHEYIRQSYSRQYYDAVETTFITIRAGLDFDDPRDIDNYLISMRRFYNNKNLDLLSIIDLAIKLALETKDASLIETLILVLGEDVVHDHPSLVDLAILKTKDYEPLKKTLYNKLRNVREDVRDYVGDGSTVHFYGGL